jgi:hypothetical protein
MAISPVLPPEDPLDKAGGQSEPAPPLPPANNLAHRAVHALISHQPQFQKAMRQASDSHLDHETHRQAALAADQAAADARKFAQFVRSLRDPGRRRRLALLLGVALVTALLGADSPLLYWAAEAFDQSPAGTTIITCLLFAASAAVALHLEVARARRRAVLWVVAAGYLALFLLRADYLMAVGGLGLAGALLQAGLLTALSALLLAASTTVLGRTVTPEIHRAEKAARQADALARQAHDAERAAASQCERHIGALTGWVLDEVNGDIPAAADLADWQGQLGRAVAARVGHPRPHPAQPEPT